MTSTPVKDAGGVMTAFAPAMAGQGKANRSGFQEILDHQANRNGPESSAARSGKERRESSGVLEEKQTAGESLKAKEPSKAPLQENGGTEEVKELSEEELEEAMEVLGSAAMQLMEQICDLFGVTMEELQGMMDQFDMQPVELLDPDKLSSVLLEAGGAEDSFALLTNGELYEDYQTVMNRLNTLLQQTEETLGMDEGQLMQLVDNPPELEPPVGAAESRIPVEVEVEDPVVEVPREQEPVREESQPGTADAEDPSVPKENPVQNVETKRQEQDNSGQHAGKNGEQGQNGNPFLQNLKQDGFQAQVQQLSQNAPVWDTDTQDIMRQIMDYMKIQVKPDLSNLEMQLHPESLGTVHVQVASKAGVVTAHFITQNEAVKAALESQMVQLQDNFSEQGIKVEAIEVTVQTHQFEQNLDQGQGRHQEEGTGKSKTRKINLNEPLNIEEMEEEEVIAAEMMTANGSTVDYTA